MKRILFFLIGSMLLLSFASCQKFLDNKYDATLLVPATVDELQALLDHTNRINKTTSNYMLIAADNIFLTDEILDEYYYSAPLYLWQDYPDNFSNPWAVNYAVVYLSNLCLERIQEAPLTAQNQDAWKNVMGSALFYRGEKYLNLLWTYAKAYDEASADQDLGIVLRASSDFNIASVRASVRASYQQVLQDLRQSIPYLPEKPQLPTRPSKMAAYGMLARTFLSMRLYDSAYHYSNKALEIKSELIDFNEPVLNDRPVPFDPYPFNSEVVYYTTTTPLGLAAYQFARIDTVLYDQYAITDLRKSLFFSPIAGYHRFRGSYAGDLYTLFSGLATDELLITRAECLARKGKTTEAIQELNTLLEKRYKTGEFIPVTITDPAEALDQILLERRKELLMRGLRWMDIKRLNKEGRGIVLKRLVEGKEYTLPPNDPRYALQLPIDIINLTGIPQN